MPIEDRSSEARTALSPFNQRAGRVLARARKALGLSQSAMATEIAGRIGLPGISQGTLSSWELGTRTIPAAAIFATTDLVREHGIEPTSLIEPELATSRLPALAEQAAAALEALAAADPERAELLRNAAAGIKKAR